MSTTASAAPEQAPQRRRRQVDARRARGRQTTARSRRLRVTVKQRAARTGQAAAQAVRDTVATASQGAIGHRN